MIASSVGPGLKQLYEAVLFEQQINITGDRNLVKSA